MSVSEEGDSAPTCCVALRPSIILRNLIVPENMWTEFPRGLGYSITDYFLYQPGFPKGSRLSVTSPLRYGLPFEEVYIETKDKVRIHAFLILQKEPIHECAPTIIFFHGNAGNIGDRLGNAKQMFNDFGCNILLVSYRGFGLSEGSPSEKGLFRDAQAAFDYADSRDDLDSNKLFVFGRSLGGAVAIDLASRAKYCNRLAGLIVENTFTSIPDLAKHLFPFRAVKWLPKFFFKNRYENSGKMGSIKCPTLFIRGCKDEMMPEEMMMELHEKCAAPLKEIKLFPDGDHNDTFESEGYGSQVLRFMCEALAAGEEIRVAGLKN